MFLTSVTKALVAHRRSNLRFKLAEPTHARIPRALLATVLGLATGLGVALALQRHHEGSRAVGQPGSVSRLPPGIGGAGASAAAPAAGPRAAVPSGPTTRSGRAAVEAFLDARARGDDAAAFGQLDRASRARYGSPARWAEEQADTPAVRGFRIESQRLTGGAVEVTAEVTHPPAIDPFDGLVPGRTVEVWRAHPERGRWRVEAEPRSVRPLLPTDTTASATVAAWLRDLAACDREAATRLQAGPDLYGPVDLRAAPCERHGSWTAGRPQPLGDPIDPQPYVAAFGPEVAGWARLVPVQGPGTRFFAVVGPLGDNWRVVGTSQSQGAG
jgi:hypothetical protein